MLVPQAQGGKVSKKSRKSRKAKAAKSAAAAPGPAEAAALAKRGLKYQKAIARHEASAQELMRKVSGYQASKCGASISPLYQSAASALQKSDVSTLQALGLPAAAAPQPQETDEDLFALFG